MVLGNKCRLSDNWTFVWYCQIYGVVTKDVCAANVRILLLKYTKVSTGEALKDVVEGFKHKWGFPQCPGVVNGTTMLY